MEGRHEVPMPPQHHCSVTTACHSSVASQTPSLNTAHPAPTSAHAWPAAQAKLPGPADPRGMGGLQGPLHATAPAEQRTRARDPGKRPTSAQMTSPRGARTALPCARPPQAGREAP